MTLNLHGSYVVFYIYIYIVYLCIFKIFQNMRKSTTLNDKNTVYIECNRKSYIRIQNNLNKGLKHRIYIGNSESQCVFI